MKCDENSDWWRPDPAYILPPRTTLARLPPMGSGGPYVESMASFFFRLACLHRVSPSVLTDHLVFPDDKTKKQYWSWIDPAFNATVKYLDKWIERLELLTGNRGLESLTFKPLASLIPHQGFMVRKSRICPLCHDQSIKEKSEMYDRLLWSVATVPACPIHGIKLVENCGCDPTARRRLIIRPNRIPGICSFCGLKLTSNNIKGIEAADKEQVQRARIVAAFIQDRHLLIYDQRIHDGFLRFVKGIIANHTCGKAYRFAQLLSVGKSKVSEWMSGEHMSTFPQVVDIAQVCKCSIVDVYSGRYEVVESVEPLSAGSCMTSNQIIKSGKKIKELDLKRYINQKDPIGFGKVAAELKTSVKFLRKYFPEESKTIVSNYRKRRRAAAKKRLMERTRLYRKIAEQLMRAGIRPNPKLISKELNYELYILSDRKICRKICMEVINANSKPT